MNELKRMASAFCSALGTDKEDLVGQLLAVEEHHGSDANFVLTSLMVQRLQKDGGVCLLALHNTFGHYHNVIMKLSGYNLLQLQERGQIEMLEPLRDLSAGLGNGAGEGDTIDLWSGSRECVARDMFLMLKDKVETVLSKTDSVCVVIDDLSDLLALGVSLRDVLSFLQYCRTLLSTFTGVSLIILSHIVEEDEEQNLLAAGLAHVADITVNVSALKTGRCSDVSGTLRVRRKTKESSVSEQWNQQNCYHFKLQDRQVKIFAPGTSPSFR